MAVGPEMTREADLGPEGSPTHLASVGGCCSGGGGSTANDLRLTWIKVRGSCADRRPHSLVPVHLSPEDRRSQDGWRWVGMQWMASSDLLSHCHCALGPLHKALLGPPSCPLNRFDFVRTVRRIQSTIEPY